MKRLGKRRLQEGYEDEGFLGPINPVSISVEGDLAVVTVDGQEVEAVKIEEGDDLIQVVEEIQADYMEGKRGKRKLQEGRAQVPVTDYQDEYKGFVLMYDVLPDGTLDMITYIRSPKGTEYVKLLLDYSKSQRKYIVFNEVNYKRSSSSSSFDKIAEEVRSAKEFLDYLRREYSDVILVPN